MPAPKVASFKPCLLCGAWVWHQPTRSTIQRSDRNGTSAKHFRGTTVSRTQTGRRPAGQLRLTEARSGLRVWDPQPTSALGGITTRSATERRLVEVQVACLLQLSVTRQHLGSFQELVRRLKGRQHIVESAGLLLSKHQFSNQGSRRKVKTHSRILPEPIPCFVCFDAQLTRAVRFQTAAVSLLPPSVLQLRPRWIDRHSPPRGCSGLAALAAAIIPRHRIPRNFHTGA